ncbi:MAG: LamG-like jellyroll fold domain-containing protein [Rikenellaceae bacterium]
MKNRITLIALFCAITLASYGGNGVVAYWSFDNDQEGTVIDSSKNENHGEGSFVTYTDGVVGKAAYFDGENSKIIIPNTPTEIVNLEQGTISCWFKFENKGGQVLPVLYLGKATSDSPPHSMILEIGHDRGDPNNRRVYLTTIASSGGVKSNGQNRSKGNNMHSGNSNSSSYSNKSTMRKGNYSSSNYSNKTSMRNSSNYNAQSMSRTNSKSSSSGKGKNFCVDSRTNLSENEWYHYVAVVSQEGNTVYINGKELKDRRYNLGSDSSYTTFFNDVPTKELLSIGYGKYSQEDPFYSFNGYIDEVMIFDKPLSKKEIEKLYNVK